MHMTVTNKKAELTHRWRV